MFTLPRLLTNVKDKDEPEDRPGAVYKIKCSGCQATYIGETGRNVTTRLNEHKQHQQQHRRTPLKNKPHYRLGLLRV